MLTIANLNDAALELAQVAAAVANFCDHAEHNEAADIQDVRRCAARLRAQAISLAAAAGEDPIVLYGARLYAIEHRNVLHHDDAFDGEEAVAHARTWRDLQLVQVAHDRVYHPDVVGLTKAEQLRHYALHVAKLAGAAASALAAETDRADFVQRRVPDMLLFGIKLSTVTGERLSDAPAADWDAAAQPALSRI